MCEHCVCQFKAEKYNIVQLLKLWKAGIYSGHEVVADNTCMCNACSFVNFLQDTGQSIIQYNTQKSLHLRNGVICISLQYQHHWALPLQLDRCTLSSYDLGIQHRGVPSRWTDGHNGWPHLLHFCMGWCNSGRKSFLLAPSWQARS